MKNNIRIAIAQINCTVGDLDGNSAKITEWLRKARGLGADIVTFPELAVTGYPPEDLLLKPKFVTDNIAALNKIAVSVGDEIAVVGFVNKIGGDIYNAAAVIHKGEIKGIYHKAFLPNYGVFDEKRYFKTGSNPSVFRAGDIAFGVNICEDIWHREGPIREQASTGAALILNINSSPYHMGKIKDREEVVKREAKANKVFIAYTNMAGGQDELVFDGRSALFGKDGKMAIEAKAFEEDLLIFDLDLTGGEKKSYLKNKLMSGHEEIYSALILGLKDYVRKNNFNKVALGLSGGIDSALVACVAKDSLGRGNVLAISMPSRYSSIETQKDAEIIANNLGIKFHKISIDSIFSSYLNTLSLHFKGSGLNIAEENIQARIRGNILMAFSNKFGYLVLNTGNKSETSAGYCTLYGDMAGGFSVIKDAPKRLVYELAEYRNKREAKNVIPKSVFKRAPTAELRPNQKDQDTLPPYDFLDKVIDLYVEKNKGFDEIVKETGHRGIVKRTLNMIDRSEYKRRQAPPGVKITPIAFGKDRRMPITNKFTPC